MAILLTTLAGISTMIGCIPIFLKETKKEDILTISLAFAAGVMTIVSLTDLIPESFTELSKNTPFFATICLFLIGINLGIILAGTIEKKVSKKESNTLYKIGLISMLAIIMHNIPEGIATYLSCEQNMSIGIKLTLAIALHNIPEGISISIPIYYALKNRRKACFYTFLSGFSEVVGGILAMIFLKNVVNSTFMGLLYSIIAGIMITISMKELLPESLSYRNYKKTSIAFLLGGIVMIISHILL